jgi:hypothetical protein
MSPKSSTLEHLHVRHNYNRMTLHITWTHARKDDSRIKFGRLSMDYGDLRIDPKVEKLKIIAEGLKISR